MIYVPDVKKNGGNNIFENVHHYNHENDESEIIRRIGMAKSVLEILTKKYGRIDHPIII